MPSYLHAAQSQSAFALSHAAAPSETQVNVKAVGTDVSKDISISMCHMSGD